MCFSQGYNSVNAIFFIDGRARPVVTLRKAFALWHEREEGGKSCPLIPTELGAAPASRLGEAQYKLYRDVFHFFCSFPCKGKCCAAALAQLPGVVCLGLKRREDFDSGFPLQANSSPPSGCLCFSIPPFPSRLFTPP